MLGKLINGVLMTPTANERKKITITNPTDEHLKLIMFFKDVIVDEEPKISSKQYLVPVYEETETTIFQHWEVRDAEEEPAEEPVNENIVPGETETENDAPPIEMEE